jgi:hypothetical protein
VDVDANKRHRWLPHVRAVLRGGSSTEERIERGGELGFGEARQALGFGDSWGKAARREATAFIGLGGRLGVWARGLARVRQQLGVGTSPRRTPTRGRGSTTATRAGRTWSEAEPSCEAGGATVNWRRSSGGRPHFHCRAAKQQLGKGTEERKEVFTIFF